MKKILRRPLLKFLAALILSFAFMAAGISAISAIMIYSYGADTKVGIKNQIYEIVIDGQKRDALEYYQAAINGEDTFSYENIFSEENSNYAFEIVPMEKIPNAKIDKLSNYTVKDCQYSKEDTRQITVITVDETKEYKLDTKENDKLKPYYLFSQEEYNNCYWALEEDITNLDLLRNATRRIDDNCVTVEKDAYDELNKKFTFDIPNENIQGAYEGEISGKDILDLNSFYFQKNDLIYFLSDVKDNEKKFNEILNKAKKYFDASYYYDESTGEMKIEYMSRDTYEVMLKSYIKSNLSANDSISEAIYLKYYDFAYDYWKVILPVSIILIAALIVYLIRVSGKHDDTDEIKLNLFDEIPLDVWIIAALGMFFVAVMFLGAGYQVANLLTGILITYFVILFCSAIGMSVATRYKVLGMRLFKNTITYIVLAFCINIFKKLLTKFGAAFIELFHNMNCYIKYIGIIAAVAIVELLFIGEGADVAMFIIFAEKIVLAVMIALALTNMKKIEEKTQRMADGHIDEKIDTENMTYGFKKQAENLNSISDGIKNAVDNEMKSEKMKTELITNVSHDIKTPLTSIINYVDLIKKEDIKDEKIKEYVDVLDRQSARLKSLIVDLIDASKASSGNVEVNLAKLDINMIIDQIIAEHADKFADKGLTATPKYMNKSTNVLADGNLLCRVFENLFVNIEKYAQNDSRVYIDVDETSGKIFVAIKNISKDGLNISGDELMERFVRGDSSRNTEGSGLGLSIAKSLMKLMKGDMQIKIDGDLFKVELIIPVCNE